MIPGRHANVYAESEKVGVEPRYERENDTEIDGNVTDRGYQGESC